MIHIPTLLNPIKNIPGDTYSAKNKNPLSRVHPKFNLTNHLKLFYQAKV